MHVAALPLVIALLGQGSEPPASQPSSDAPAPLAQPTSAAPISISDQTRLPQNDNGAPASIADTGNTPMGTKPTGNTGYGNQPYGASSPSLISGGNAAAANPITPSAMRAGQPTPNAFNAGGFNKIQQVQNLGQTGAAAATAMQANRNYQNQPVPRGVEVMNFIMRPPSAGGLPGKPTVLYEVLSNIGNGSQRQAIRTYWRLRELTGLYHTALREADYLKNANTVNPIDQERLDQAHMRAVQRSDELGAQAVAAQRQLAQLMSRRSSAPDELPLASDYGCTGTYYTRYETMRAQGVVGPQARVLHDELPIALIYLQSVMELAGKEDHDLRDLAQKFNGNNTSDLLAKVRSARAHNQAYLRAVRVYNQLIGDYATSISIPNETPKMLAEMLLIPANGHTEVARVRSTIRQQSAEISVADNASGTVAPAFREVPISTTDFTGRPTAAVGTPTPAAGNAPASVPTPDPAETTTSQSVLSGSKLR